MSLPQTYDSDKSDLRDASWNAVAIAGISYQGELTALRSILRSAHVHGMTRSDLVYASGLDASFVSRLLDEVG